MAFMNIGEILIEDYNFHDRPETWYNHNTIDEIHSVYKIARRVGHTNVKIKINTTEFIEANS